MVTEPANVVTGIAANVCAYANNLNINYSMWTVGLPVFPLHARPFPPLIPHSYPYACPFHPCYIDINRRCAYLLPHTHTLPVMIPRLRCAHRWPSIMALVSDNETVLNNISAYHQ